VLVIELRDSVVFSVEQTVMEFERIGCFTLIRLGYVRLVWKYSLHDSFRLRIYEHNTFPVLDRYMLLQKQKLPWRRFCVSASIFRLT
jgi:hypothetical protein